MHLKYVSSILDGRLETSGLSGTTHHYASDAELVILVETLIAEGHAFVHLPAGWPPAAVLEDLQERGLLTVPFTAITWQGPGDYTTFPIPSGKGPGSG